jgi:hypothetical protein
VFFSILFNMRPVYWESLCGFVQSVVDYDPVELLYRVDRTERHVQALMGHPWFTGVVATVLGYLMLAFLVTVIAHHVLDEEWVVQGLPLQQLLTENIRIHLRVMFEKVAPNLAFALFWLLCGWRGLSVFLIGRYSRDGELKWFGFQLAVLYLVEVVTSRERFHLVEEHEWYLLILMLDGRCFVEF